MSLLCVFRISGSGTTVKVANVLLEYQSIGPNSTTCSIKNESTFSYSIFFKAVLKRFSGKILHVSKGINEKKVRMTMESKWKAVSKIKHYVLLVWVLV